MCTNSQPKPPRAGRGQRTCLGSVLILALAGGVAEEPAHAAAAADAEAADAADGAVQEIVVTAQKREERARDVPVTITALDGVALEQRGLTGLNDYAKFVPGLIYNGSGLGERSGPDIVIRGVANSRLFDFETNIATATTGFMYGELPAYSFDPELVDVQRVEVLKGPQGTLYGAAAMGGLVKVVPNQPQFSGFSGSLQGGLSTLDNVGATGGLGWNGAGVINLPLSDVLALRFSFHGSHDPGWLNIHTLTGNPNEAYGRNGLVGFNSLAANVYGAGEFQKNVNTSESGGGRVALRFKPDEHFDATLAFMYDSRHLDSLPNYEPVLSVRQSRLTADQFQLQPSATNYSLASLEMSYDFGLATLHSISGWIQREHNSSVDFAGTTYGALGGDGLVPLPTPAPVTFAVTEHIISQELRLQGEQKDLLWSGSGLDWTIGGFYQRENRDAVGGVTVGADWLTDAQLPLRAPPSGTQTVWDGEYVARYTNQSGFADITAHLMPRLSVSAGIRYSKQDVEATRTDFSNVFASAPPTGNSSIQEPVAEKSTTPRATIVYGLNDDINLYAAYSKGFRIGGHNPIGNLTTAGCANALKKFGITDPESAAEFKSDKIRNIEAGIKSAFQGGRIVANVTGFRVDWTDLQTAIQLDQYDIGCGASFVGNAGAARITGVDAEVKAALDRHWQVALSGQYADGKIVKVVAGSPGTLGAPLESTPKTQLTAGVDYRMSPRDQWDADIRLDYAYVGARNFSNTNTPVDPNYQLPGYSTVNLRLTASHDSWEYTTFVNNLTNAIPQLGVQIFSGGPGDYSGAYAPRAQRFVATSAPRTFGVLVKKNF
ncbi:MAG: TonB-dependent receptor [Proteobacteria bacterium]|nr:TonB-dependent receptor [Pseudomonadota bacterium]